MTNVAYNLEGFESTSPKASLVFQNPKNWHTAEADGVMVMGIYEGPCEEVDQFGKTNFKFTSNTDGLSFDKDGNEKPFVAGTTVIINTSSNIASKLKDIEIGTEVAVKYLGQNKLRSGPYKGKFAHSYDVLIKR